MWSGSSRDLDDARAMHYRGAVTISNAQEIVHVQVAALVDARAAGQMIDGHRDGGRMKSRNILRRELPCPIPTHFAWPV